MPQQTKLSKEQEEQLTILNRCGVRYSTLQREFGISYTTIRNSKRRANVEKAYKTVKGHGNSFEFAVDTYNSTQDGFIKQKIEQYVFSPIIEKTVDKYTKYGFYPKIDNYLRLWHTIFSDSNWERYSTKLTESEIKQIASEEITKVYSKEDLVKKIDNQVSERYYKPFPDSLKRKIDEALNTLSARESAILRLRFGLDDGCPKIIEEVGVVFGVTRERIRQIEAKALKGLRHPIRSRKIRNIAEVYAHYLKDKPEDYMKREELGNILSNSIRLLENKEGGLERKFLKTFQKHRADLYEYHAISSVKESLYVNLMTDLTSYMGDLENKLDSLLLMTGKGIKSEKADEILDKLHISEREKLKEKLSLPVSEFELSVRTANCLMEARIKQIGDLVQLKDENLLRYRNFGKKSLNEIEGVLKSMGLSLGMKDLPKYK